MPSPAALPRRTAEALALWAVVAAALGWAAWLFDPVGSTRWQLGACGLALAGFLVHFLFLYAKRRNEAADGGPGSVMLAITITLGFIAIGAPVCTFTRYITTDLLIPPGLPVHEAAVVWLLSSYWPIGIPAALAGLADAVAIVVLGNDFVERGFPIGYQAALGAAAGLFAFAVFGALVVADWFITEGFLAWCVPSLVGGAVAGIAVNGVASRHLAKVN